MILLYQFAGVLLWLVSLGALGMAGYHEEHICYLLQGWLATYEVDVP